MDSEPHWTGTIAIQGVIRGYEGMPWHEAWAARQGNPQMPGQALRKNWQAKAPAPPQSPQQQLPLWLQRQGGRSGWTGVSQHERMDALGLAAVLEENQSGLGQGAVPFR